jgi:hypothetical protein
MRGNKKSILKEREQCDKYHNINPCVAIKDYSLDRLCLEIFCGHISCKICASFKLVPRRLLIYSWTDNNKNIKLIFYSYSNEPLKELLIRGIGKMITKYIRDVRF